MRDNPPRVWGPPETLQGTASPILSRHLVRTLSLQPGDVVDLVCGDGYHYRMRLADVHPHHTRLEVVERLPSTTDPTVPVRLYLGALKGDQMLYVIQQVTELGVAEVVPMETERSYRRLPFRGGSRWQQAAWDSVIVCGRACVPVVHDGMTFEQAVAASAAPCRLLLWERRPQLVSCRTRLQDGTGGVDLFVGPEEGFTDAEAHIAQSAGIVPCTLGPRMLRGLTAAIAAVTLALDARDQLR